MKNISEKNSGVTPTVIVVFGTTGDLSRRKLIPALLDLYVKGFMPEKFSIVGFSRKEMSDDEYRQFAKDAINEKKHEHKEDVVDDFLKHLSYETGSFGNIDTYGDLARHLAGVDDIWGVCSNKLFYLAVPPSLYDVIFENLANSGLTVPCGGGAGWTRVLVEKPFGKDLKTAQELDKKLGLLFKEEQIFRIDHYLAKETIQNILSFRFSNLLFEPVWNNQYIEKVEIKLYETLGVGSRGAFYDDIGAIRDVGQNHILQMLSFVAMDNPGKLDSVAIRQNRARVLGSLRPIDVNNLTESIVVGQYDGFLEEPKVSRDSKTETYFKMKVFIDNDRWKGVPFYLESGKKLKEKKTQISVYFKKTPTCVCPEKEEGHTHQNILTFDIQPNEGISVRFWAKKPGLNIELESKNLSFSYKHSTDGAMRLPDAYEKVLFDCIKGDQILFTSTEEVSYSWKFITPIIENLKNIKIHIYKQGSDGPNVAL